MTLYLFDKHTPWHHRTIPNFTVTPVSLHERPGGGNSVWVRSHKDGTKLNYNFHVFAREFSIESPQAALERGWDAANERWELIDSSHSWRYGHDSVVCVMCGARKGDIDMSMCRWAWQ